MSKEDDYRRAAKIATSVFFAGKSAEECREVAPGLEAAVATVMGMRCAADHYKETPELLDAYLRVQVALEAQWQYANEKGNRQGERH